MKKTSWIQLLVPALLTVVGITGCGTAAANAVSHQASASNAANASNMSQGSAGNSMAMSGQTVADKVMRNDVLVGAAASQPMGAGNGTFLIEHAKANQAMRIPLATGANGFQAALVGKDAYVPTLQGTTYVVDVNAGKLVAQFATPKGARIADVAESGRLLLVTGGKSVTAYSLPQHKQQWQLAMGGNSLVVVGSKAYLSSNMMKKTAVINLSTGKIIGSIPVGQIEDSVFDPQTHTLWLANWTTGDMTIVDTKTDKVQKVIHRSEGGGFNMNQMMMAKGGFMQLAVGPLGKYVYAASFSGNIMVYNATQETFAKDIPVGTMAKLSGLAIDGSGQYAYTTVENKDETVAVSLKTGKVMATYPKLMANRWFLSHMN